MDSHSLLCDEVWLTTIPPTPTILDHNQTPDKSRSDSYSGSLYTDKDKEEDWEQALNVCLEKELGYMPEPGYQDRLQLSGMVLSRFRVIQWLVKSQSRLNLLCQTVFNAANYFDRFVSMNQCKMEDLDHSFQSGLIQRMELTLLKTLEWKLGSITPYSYIDLLMCDIESTNSFLLGDLTSRLTELLLDTLLDYEFLGFRPAVIAISAVRCVIGGSLPSTYMTRLIPEDQKYLICYGNTTDIGHLILFCIEHLFGLLGYCPAMLLDLVADAGCAMFLVHLSNGLLQWVHVPAATSYFAPPVLPLYDLVVLIWFWSNGLPNYVGLLRLLLTIKVTIAMECRNTMECFE
ncbi:hypothetical protein U1Q18_008475 [Sarracenia purpurea var. burkii]